MLQVPLHVWGERLKFGNKKLRDKQERIPQLCMLTHIQASTCMSPVAKTRPTSTRAMIKHHAMSWSYDHHRCNKRYNVY